MQLTLLVFLRSFILCHPFYCQRCRWYGYLSLWFTCFLYTINQ